MSRDGVSAFLRMRRDTPFPWKQLYVFWMIPPSSHQLRTYFIDGSFLEQ